MDRKSQREERRRGVPEEKVDKWTVVTEFHCFDSWLVRQTTVSLSRGLLFEFIRTPQAILKFIIIIIIMSRTLAVNDNYGCNDDNNNNNNN